MSKKASKQKNKMEFGVIGLGRMGGALTLQAIEKGWRVVGYVRSPERTRAYERVGGRVVSRFTISSRVGGALQQRINSDEARKLNHLRAAGDGKGDELNKDLFVVLAYLCVAA